MAQEKIVFNIGGDAQVIIDEFLSKEGDSIFRLFWTDCVANAWEEYYPTLAITLMRASLLAQCVGESEAELFAEDSLTFAHTARKYLEGAVI